jgi:hypothetical protein
MIRPGVKALSKCRLKARLDLRRRERAEIPVDQLWRAGGHRHQLRHLTGLGAKLHIVTVVLGLIPFLDQKEFVRIDFAF